MSNTIEVTEVSTEATPTVSEVKPKRTPTTGQSGPKLDLKKSKLNDKEKQLVEALVADVNPQPINALAAVCFPDQTAVKANSWARNSLRRLARAGWIEKIGRGTYRLSTEGRSRYTAPAEAV